MWNLDSFNKKLKKLPKLYSTENIKADDKKIVMHLFFGSADWWICEGDEKEGVLFGFACLGDPDMAEWGYVSIEELKALKAPMKGPHDEIIAYYEVDFDKYWKPRKFSEVGWTA